MWAQRDLPVRQLSGADCSTSYSRGPYGAHARATVPGRSSRRGASLAAHGPLGKRDQGMPMRGNRSPSRQNVPQPPSTAARAVMPRAPSPSRGANEIFPMDLPVIIPDAIPSDLQDLHDRAVKEQQQLGAAPSRRMHSGSSSSSGRAASAATHGASGAVRHVPTSPTGGQGRPSAEAPGTGAVSALSLHALFQMASAPGAAGAGGQRGSSRGGGAARGAAFSAAAMQRTMAIKAVRDWRQLPYLVDQIENEEGGLDAFSAAALITHVAQRAAADPPAAADLPTLEFLQSAALAAVQPALDTPHCRPRQLANVCWALARLGLPSGTAFLANVLVPASYSALPWYEPQHLSNTAWALAVAGVSPEDAWWEEFLTVAYVVLERRGFEPQHLANLLWSLERQGIMPDREWLSAYFDCVTAAVQHLNGQDVSNIMLSMAQMGLMAGSAEPDQAAAARALSYRLVARLTQLLQQARERPQGQQAQGQPRAARRTAAAGVDAVGTPPPGAAVSDQSLANSLWAVASMALQPPKPFIDAVLQQLEDRLGAATPAAAGAATGSSSSTAGAAGRQAMHPVPLTVILWSAATLGLALPGKLMAAVYEQLDERWLQGADARCLANLLWTLATAPEQQARPPAACVEACCRAVAAELPSMNGQAISNTVYALCVLKARPPAQWMSAVINHFHRNAGAEASPQAISNVLWSLAKMGFRLDDTGLSIMTGLAKGRLAEWVARRGGATQAGAPPPPCPFSSQELSNVLYALAVFGFRPDAELQGLVLEGVRDRLVAATPQDLSNVVWSCAILGITLPDPWVADYATASAARLPAYGPADLAQTLYGVARTRIALGAGWTQAAMREAARVVPNMGPQDLSNLGWAMLQLGLRPEPALAGLFASRLVSCSTEAEPQHLALGVWALGKWRFRPGRRHLSSLEVATFRKMPSMRPSELAAMLSGFAGMGHDPDPDWLSDCVGHIASRSEQFGAQDWTVVLHALSHVKGSDSGAEVAEEVEAFVDQLLPRLLQLSPRALVGLAYSCGCIGSTPAMRKLVTRAMALVAVPPAANGGAAGALAVTPSELAALLWSAVRVRAVPPREFRAAFFAYTLHGGSGAQAVGLPPGALASLVWSSSRLRMRAPGVWRRTMARRVPAALPSMQAKEVAMLVRGMAWHRIIPQGSADLAALERSMHAALLQLGNAPGAGQQQQQQQAAPIVAAAGSALTSTNASSSDSCSSSSAVALLRSLQGIKSRLYHRRARCMLRSSSSGGPAVRPWYGAGVQRRIKARKAVKAAEEALQG